MQRRVNPYRDDNALKGNPRCMSCQGVFYGAKWLSREQAAERKVVSTSMDMYCPACRQLRDHYALGVVELRLGDDMDKLSTILQTLVHTERIQRARNDQERILWTGTAGGVTRVYTTLPELARSLGRILEKTFKGKTEYVRSGKDVFLHVIWEAAAPMRGRAYRTDHRTERRSKHWRGRGASTRKSGKAAA